MTSAFPLPSAPRTLLPGWALSKWAGFVFWGVLVCLAGGIVLLPPTDSVNNKNGSFSADEPGWIAASYYYTDLLKKGDFEWRKWECSDCSFGYAFGSLNMHLGEWLIAIPLQMDSRTKAQQYAGAYDVDRSFEDNVRLGNLPPKDVLVRARTAPALFGILCCFLAFAIGFWAFNTTVGVLAGGLMVVNPVLLRLSGQVMTDAFYNFFLLAGCLALTFFLKADRPRQILFIVSLAGVLAGLATSVKITGILIGGMSFVLAAAWCFYTRKSGTKQLLAQVVLFFVFALATAYVLNPLFWPSWHELRPGAAVEEFRSVSHEAVTTKRIPWTNREAFLADSRYPQLQNLSHPLEFPLLFSRWSHLMRGQASRGWGNWNGPRLFSLHESLVQFLLPRSFWPGSAILRLLLSLCVVALAASGIIHSLRKSHVKDAATRDDSRLIPLIYLITNYLLIVVFMRLNWERYYLPTLAGLEIILAAGVYQAFRTGLVYVRSRRRSTETAG